MRRLVSLPFSALVCAVVAATALAGSTASWAQAEIRLVTSRGLMGGKAASFRPQAPLNRSTLDRLVADITEKPSSTSVSQTPATVTMEELDATLVRGLGLSSSSSAFARGARRAGIRVPTRFGTEAVARLLSLRKNHPANQDGLELLPTDTATRAEAAYSAAQILRFRGWEVQNVKTAASTFSLPALGTWQKRILTTAFGFVGYPYIWGGTSEHPESPFGVKSHGGFDCSGFVWRVYKTQAYAGGRSLATALKGRTTFAMSTEVPRGKRIPFARLQPGDLVFFGSRGPRSKAAEIGHMGIYAGGGWLVHSSSRGVALDPMTGWYREQFAWGRRPLAEAGLVPA